MEGDRLAERPAVEELPDTERGLNPYGNGGRWTEARWLRLGDVFLTPTGKSATVSGLTIRIERVKLYNLHVEGLHLYAVGDAGVLVHNSGGRHGGAAHRAKIREIANRLEGRGWTIRSGGGGAERLVRIPGTNRGRYPDITAERGGRTIAIHVGKRNRRGDPVKREWDALKDLRDSGFFDHVWFFRY